MIDDASEIHNLTFEASEHIHTTSPAAAAALTRRFRAVGGHLQRGRMLRGGSRDMKSAYKQLGVHPSQLRYSIIAIFDPSAQAWRFAISWALPFGMSGAVLHFNRVPSSLPCAAAGWLCQSRIFMMTFAS